MRLLPGDGLRTYMASQPLRQKLNETCAEGISLNDSAREIPSGRGKSDKEFVQYVRGDRDTPLHTPLLLSVV